MVTQILPSKSVFDFKENLILKKVRIFFVAIVLNIGLTSVNKLSAQEIFGNDFWFSFTQNDQIVGVGGTVTNSPLTFLIISVHNVTGTITAPGLGWSTSFTVAAGGQTAIAVPYTNAAGTINFYTDQYGVPQGRGFHIVTNQNATVYAINNSSASVDGEVVLPTNMLGTSYVVASRSTAQYDLDDPASFTVGATQANTHIQIKTWYQKSSGVQRDTIINVTLNTGQTYYYGFLLQPSDGINNPATNLYNQLNTLTGSTITSDKPVYVIGQTMCSRMIDCGACDVMMNELQPTSAWGTRYVLVQPIKRTVPSASCGNYSATTGDYVEIIGEVGQKIKITNWNGTTTKTIPPLPFASSISPYSFIWYDNTAGSLTGAESNGEANLILTSTQPFAVVQYQKDAYSDNLLYTDPESTVDYPEAMWSNSYLAGTVAAAGANANAAVQDIVIVINNVGTPAPISTISVTGAGGAPAMLPTTACSGGNPPPGEGCWQPINGPTAGDQYMFYRYPVTPNVAYTVTSTGGYNFGFYFATRSDAASYIEQGGGGAEPPITVPIRLLSFDAILKDNYTALLTWNTASEVNNDYFAVERSVDGNDFDVIGTRKGEGNSSTIHSYDFVDNQFPALNSGAQTLYYRLKQIDYDGHFTYSPIVSIEPKGVLSITPNPVIAGQTLQISYQHTAAESVNIRISNAMGVTVCNKMIVYPAGVDVSMVNTTEALTKGVYFIELSSGDKNEIKKLVVQ